MSDPWRQNQQKGTVNATLDIDLSDTASEETRESIETSHNESTAKSQFVRVFCWDSRFCRAEVGYSIRAFAAASRFWTSCRKTFPQI